MQKQLGATLIALEPDYLQDYFKPINIEKLLSSEFYDMKVTLRNSET
jgi:hypothetical protein